MIILCLFSPSGPRCDVCQGGFYGDPAGGAGVQRPCRPCQCNGHIDIHVAGSCDRSSGECLKCLNNTTGWSCEACEQGFYHRRATDACKRKNEGHSGRQACCQLCIASVESSVNDYQVKM